MNPDILQVVNLILNILIIPLLAMQWNLRTELAKLDTRFSTWSSMIETRLVRLESAQDARKGTV